MAEVVLEGVSKSFGSAEVIRDVDLKIADGEFCVFVGPSGCGKSTLLRLVAGLEDVSSGRVLIGGRDVTRMTPSERKVAMVFQSYALYPHMTVGQNITFGLEGTRAGKSEAKAKLDRVADMLQLRPLLERKPADLSGGQRQRVAIGRAIVREPALFLFDEPLSNLDAALRGDMRVEIGQLHADLGATMIYVTHDQVEAMTMADRIVVLNGGRVEQVGSPLELYYKPANLFVARFIGSNRMNTLPVTISGEGVELPGGTRLALGGIHGEAGRRATLGIRPEHLKLDGSGELLLEGQVKLVEHLGSDTVVHVAVGEATVTVRDPGYAEVKAGETCRIGVPAEAVHLFGEDEQAIRHGVPARLAERFA